MINGRRRSQNSTKNSYERYKRIFQKIKRTNQFIVCIIFNFLWRKRVAYDVTTRFLYVLGISLLYEVYDVCVKCHTGVDFDPYVSPKKCYVFEVITYVCVYSYSIACSGLHSFRSQFEHPVNKIMHYTILYFADMRLRVLMNCKCIAPAMAE